MSRLSRLLTCAAALALALTLTACGGGATSTTKTVSGSGSSSGTSTAAPATANHATCDATSAQTSIANNGSGNASTIYMDLCTVAGSGSISANIPYVSVYLCAPGSTTACAWIDHIEVDTGSEGLRVLAEAIPPNVLAALPAMTAATFAPSTTGNIGECYAFVNSFFWGGVRSADITLGGTVAPPGDPAGTGLKISNLSFQVLNDTAVPATPPDGTTINASGTTVPVPANCGVPGQTAANQSATADTIRANGILGIGLFSDDCHTNGNTANGACSQNGAPASYYACTGTSCKAIGPVINPNTGFVNTPNPITAGKTVANPVSAAGKANLAITLSASAAAINASAGGAAGSVTYGPAVQPTTTLVADPFNAYIQSTVNGKVYGVGNVASGQNLIVTGSYIDSGSNTLYFSNGGTTAAGLADQNISGLSTCPTPAGSANAFAFACVSGGGSLTLPTTMGSYTPLAGGSANFSINPSPVVTDTLALFRASNGPAYPGLTIVDSAYTAPGIFAWGLPFFYQRTIWFGIYDPNTPGTPYYGF